MSGFEEHSFLTGVLLLMAGVVLAMVYGPGGTARALGAIGLGAFGLCALSRGLRLYLANVTASMPESVGRVGVRVRPGRVSTAATAAFAVLLPCAVFVALVALVEWGWLAIAGVLLPAPSWCS